ncbi:hypothetical protein QMA69_10440 [Burkholderia pseudomallei]|uniref:hypothetical protein n=1 Tax=Burkholderia pseudomallei TaxID=28450 RepID=UPI002DB82EA8|nr:hypothetical protein [Burkholderia pseudomallei]MEB5485025.1 hypothetical protein [Burkholderia pseudomallei]MEB5491784.1 hypothetical protein [Burkholderia pseudomallei]MEB5498574.1 hypothetical protein [Burkholderia pseudomallei]MEB5503758.1 hypothetical protein [Burkholderia pseudomallei]MEB5511511.1 hypothetical protein [Burkholderia pseudomallei]
MMAADSLRRIVPPGVFFRWPPLCRRACRASDDFAYSALHVAQHPATLATVQASCLERAWPMAVAAFPGARAASSTAPPSRRRPEQRRRAKAEGKIKGRGTSPLENVVCTWGERGTRHRAQCAAKVRNAAPTRAKSRASHARPR